MVIEKYVPEQEKNSLVNKIEIIKQKYEGKDLFPFGKINKISYAGVGDLLLIFATGDVPTNFKSLNFVIKHPDSKSAGPMKGGEIGFRLDLQGLEINQVPITEDTAILLKKIYEEYTGQTPEAAKQHFYVLRGRDNVNEFAKLGLYQEILDKETEKRRIENQRKNS